MKRPDHVIASEHEARDLATRRRQKSTQFVGIRDLGIGSIIPLRQLAPHEVQFGESSFRRVRFHGFFIESDDFASVEIGNVAILVFRGSNPGGVSACLSLASETCLYN